MTNPGTDDFSRLVNGLELMPADDMLPQLMVGGKRYGVDGIGGKVIKLALHSTYVQTMLSGALDEASIVTALRNTWERPARHMAAPSTLVVNGLGAFTGLNEAMMGPVFLGALDGSRDIAGSVKGIGFGRCVLNPSFEDLEAMGTGKVGPDDIDWRHSPLLVLSDVVCSDSDTPERTIELPAPYICVPILGEEIQLHRAIPVS